MAVRFNGNTANYLSRTSGTLLGIGESDVWTVMLWARWNGVSGWQNICYIGTGVLIAAAQINDNKLNLWATDGTDGTTSLNANTWYHITVVRSGYGANGFQAYLNGVLEINRASAGGGGVASNYIGSWEGGSDAPDARYAACKIWTAALTADEIASEMHVVRPVRTANLCGWYPMFGATGEQGRDYSGNGYDFTTVGTLTAEDGPPVSWGGAPYLVPYVASGGGTEYDQSVAGAFSPAAALVRQSTALRVGATTPSSALIRAMSTARAGATSPAGSTTQQTTRPLAGAAAPSGVLSSIKSTIQALSGTLAPAGVLARSTARAAAGAITPAAVALKQIARALSGSITPAGALTSIKLFLVEMVGTLAPAGGLLRTTARALAGALTPVGAALKGMQRALTGAVSPDGALASIKTFLAYIEGVVTAAGVLARTPLKTLSGALAPTAETLRSTARALAGSFTPDGVFSALRLVFVTLAGVIVPSGGLVRQMTRPLAGVIAPAAAITKAIARQLAGAVSAIGALIASALGLNPLAQATASDALVYSATTSDSSVYLGAASNAAAYSAVVTDAIAG